MAISLRSSSFASLGHFPQVGKPSGWIRSPSRLLLLSTRSFPRIFASSSSSSVDAVSSFSEIVPDTVVFDDFERFPPTAATVSSSLLLGICSLPDTKFKSAIETALADSECYEQRDPSKRLSCFYDKALVNVGADLAMLVPGRVSTEVDARLAYDTHAIIHKVHELLKLYNEIEVPPERLLFKIPSTWQGIEASRLLESEGIQTHLTFVYSFSQAAAAAQAGASVIQIFVGRLRDWARNHSGDPEIEAASKRGEDAGVALVTKAYNYIHKYGHKSRLMAAAIRNKQDIFSLLGVDYIIAPLKILQSLKDSITYPDEKYSYVRRLSPSSAMLYNFSEEELVKWDQLSLASAMGPAAEELLTAGLEGYVNQALRVEEHFGKIWPPPNV
ncbi:transaldolase isoform X3 [Dioscorea cayenensis subsp. rotundata]|uniref:transaldolase n=1 Tax=Dioscorea cayennensis subsp. rotundata TaxID=55577 RepID=A0AB40CNM1_DIOCR|nr:transaldolase isoform X3 [Dioscorea cayenensis subsp. rotundata]